MNQKNAKTIAINAACTGAVAAGLMYYFLGEVDTVNYFGQSFSAPVAAGLACGVGSIASDLGSEMVIKKLGMTNQFVNSSTALVQASVGGISSSAVLYAGGMPASGLISAVVVGAAAKFGGDYINFKAFDPINGLLGPIF